MLLNTYIVKIRPRL